MKTYKPINYSQFSIVKAIVGYFFVNIKRI